MSRRPLLLATLAGTVFQVAMVVAGHSNPSIKGLFAVGGMGLSLLAGALYAYLAAPISKGPAATGGALAGALCGFLGILVSYALGDVPASLLALGSISSGVTGALGGVIAALATGSGRRAAAGAALLLSAFASPAHAQLAPAVRAAPAAVTGDTSATLADFQWLVGRWEGTMPSMPGAVAEVTFGSAKAGLMPGMMRLVKGDEVLVVELISMVDTPRGIEMRFRHFSSTLEAYERDFKQSMRLTKHEQVSDTFENTFAYDSTLMSTQPRKSMFVRQSNDAYVAHSDIIDAKGKPAVIEVTYRRAR